MARYMTIAQIADYFGIDRTTFYEVLKRQPEVFLHYKKTGLQKYIDTLKSLRIKYLE